jgi:hypothetical protein
MRRKGPRPICFTCSEIVDGKLVSEVMEKETADDARAEFKARFNVEPSICLGPFYRKRTGVLQHTQSDIVFSGGTGEFVHNGWVVTVMFLSKPEGCGYVFYESRIDDKKMPKPPASIVRLDDMQEKT